MIPQNSIATICNVTCTILQAYSDDVDPFLLKSEPHNLDALNVDHIVKMLENLHKKYNVTICE